MTQHLGRKAQDPDYGVGEHSIDCDALGLIDDEELTQRMIKTFESPDYHPPRLPAVAMELLAVSQNPEVEFEEIESLLEQDAVLAGEILSIARSAFYSRGARVNSIRDALVRLGLAKLRDVVVHAAMTMRVFRSKTYGGCMDRLKDHSRVTAHVCRILSKHTQIPESQAFLCGLLHDVGIAGILLVLGDASRGKKAPDLAVLWPAIDAAHGKAGANMIARWGLPPEIALAVGAHHQVKIGGQDHALAAAVCLAEALAAEIDMAFVPAEDGGGETTELNESGLIAHGRIDRSDQAVVHRAREALSVSDDQCEQIRSAALEWCESEARA